MSLNSSPETFKQYFWDTEQALNPSLHRDPRSYSALWLPLQGLDIPKSCDHLNLHKITSNDDWSDLFLLRVKVEKQFGILDHNEVKGMIQNIRAKVKEFGGCWYLARLQNQVVGGIGLVPFETSKGLIGRLQDVDVAPDYQGQGLGNKILRAIVHAAKAQDITALCLKAETPSWVRDWYLRFGFTEIDQWEPAK